MEDDPLGRAIVDDDPYYVFGDGVVDGGWCWGGVYHTFDAALSEV